MESPHQIFTLTERIRSFLGIRREDMAGIIGVSRQTYHRWGQGRTPKQDSIFLVGQTIKEIMNAFQNGVLSEDQIKGMDLQERTNIIRIITNKPTEE
jgi:DNA-binding XRE family transcriptional regulator